MRKYFVTLFFIGWFFAMKAEVAPGIAAVTVVGPFKSAAACNTYRDEAVPALKAAGFSGAISPCVERRET